jgi:GT2 family glycosyltransferase
VIVFVDADVLVHIGAFNRIRDAFEHDEGLTALFGSYDDGNGSTGHVATFRNLLHHHVHHSSPGQAGTFWSGLGAVRRNEFLACGGFDEDRFSAASVEDIDLGVRLRARGARIVLNPKVQGTHLKNWGLWEMVRTDFLLRGVPWVEILLRNRGAPFGTLNLSWKHRLSAVMSLIGLLGLAARRPGVAVAALMSFLTLNTRFYVLLARRHGMRTSAAGIGLHLLHHLVSIAAVPAGVAAHLQRRARGLPPVGGRELARERIVGREEDRAEALAEV